MDSIAIIEQKINALKQQKGKKNYKKEIEQLKSNINKIYNKNKAKITNFEKTNYEYLACIRSTNNFYKLVGNSALFYACDISKKLNIPVNLQPDGDYLDKSDIGVVSIRNIDIFTRNLASLKILKVRTKDQTKNLCLYKLPWKYSKDQLDKMLSNNTLKLKTFNHVVLVDNPNPTLFLQITELIKATYENVRKMPSPIERKAFGYYCVERSADMFHIYLDVANGRRIKKTGFLEIKTELNLLKNQIKIIADLNIWNAQVCCRIGDIIIKIQNIIEQELSTEK